MTNTNSILNSVKRYIGLTDTQTEFDSDLIIHINTVLSILRDLGIGKEDFEITGASEVWTDFETPIYDIDYQKVKTYVCLRVKLIFDPPSSSFVLSALQETIKELEWRLHIDYEYQSTKDDGG